MDPRRFDAMLFGWGADYPAASQYVAVLASCDKVSGHANVSGYCDPELEEQIAAGFEAQVAEPGQGRDAWAAADRAAVDAAAVIPFGSSRQQVLVGPRVGNTQVQPGWGPLIAQMWVQ